MAMTGIRKAAMLLMSLDATTAAELLKGLSPDTVTNIAVELAYLDASGFKSQEQSHAVAVEFCSSLRKDKQTGIKLFLGKMLESSVGAKRSQEIQGQINDLLKKRDPFMAIRELDPMKLLGGAGRRTSAGRGPGAFGTAAQTQFRDPLETQRRAAIQDCQAHDKSGVYQPGRKSSHRNRDS